MKKYFILLMSFLIAYSCFSQENNEKDNIYFSSEISLIYPHYWVKYENKFNYGIGCEISENINNFKISTGLFYTTKRYYEQFPIDDTIDKITYNINYYNIPIFLSFPILNNKNKSYKFLISSGMIFNIPRNYHSLINFKNNSVPIENDKAVKYKSGSSLRLNIKFYKRLSDLFNVYIGIYSDYKFQLDNIMFNNSSPLWHPSYSEDRLLTGINIGIEWINKKK